MSFIIPGYNFVRRDRETRGGGVGIYIRKNITFSIVRHNLNPNDSEIMIINFCVKNKNILFTCIYRPPSSNVDNFTDWLEDIFALTVPFYDIVIFVGVFNDFLKQHAPKYKL